VTRKRSASRGRLTVVLPTLLVVLLLGVLSGAALAAGKDDGGVQTTTAATDGSGGGGGTTTTADPGTTTGAGTTTGGGGTTTDPGTTTDAGTTTTPTTTSDTTTGSGQTTTNSGGDIGQTTTQGNSPPTTSTTGTPPVAPCDTTQITCGNNAATQIALVTQTCTAVSDDSTISVQVQNLGGTPVNNFTITNNTTCLNDVSITQVVQQFCVGCTIIVIPPPTIQSIYVTQVLPAPSSGTSPGSAREAYCMPQPVMRTDGTMGTFVDLVAGQPAHDLRYAGAVPAVYLAGVGLTCPDGETSASDNVPVFTLTVPASFVGQYLNLCLQPSNPKVPPTCHQIRIDSGATISVPVTGHVTAVVKPATVPVADRPKSQKQIATATAAIQGAVTASKPKAKHHTTSKTKKGKKP
jgi:hypothetical protein